MRITFAPGTGTRPHFHDQARYITVIDGTWWVAKGPDAKTYDVDEMVEVKAWIFFISLLMVFTTTRPVMKL